jgi:chorismate lyase/3-hydroxybenzoate synthase
VLQGEDTLAPDTAAPLAPGPPPWTADLMPGARASASIPGVQVIASGPLLLLSTTIPDASHMASNVLRDEVSRAYSAIGLALQPTGASAIRWWNYLPDPGRIMAPGLDRYMVFNAGRHDGYRRSFNEVVFERSLPTASAVGITGDDLIVHCLASTVGGRAVENPRQKPAWQYSHRYGPVPPSFSRAMLTSVRNRPLLLIGGTASVVGEDSMHAGDVSAQIEETFRNLASLVASARGETEPVSRSLSRIVDVRAYVTRPTDAGIVRAALSARCPSASRIELAAATLCRAELLVEIEGVAEI